MPISTSSPHGEPIRFTWTPAYVTIGVDPVDDDNMVDDDVIVIDDDDTVSNTHPDNLGMSHSLRDLLRDFSEATAVPRPTPPATPPAAERQRIQIGDLVEVVSVRTNLRMGEVGVVDYIDSACGRRSCFECEQLTVSFMRPSSYSSWDCDDLVQYTAYLTVSDVVPVAPDQFNQDVRCDNAEHGRGGTHRHIGDCESPVRVRGSASTSALLSPWASSTWATEIEAARQRRAETIARFNLMRSGQRYQITGSGGYYGYIARLRGTPNLETGRVNVDLENLQGHLVRRSTMIEVDSLGGRFYPWQLGMQAPHFIRFAPTQYSGTVTVEDREVVESLDEHECDHACFDYGCTAINASPSSFLIDESDDDDMEPEDHIGDIPIMPYNYRPELIFSGDGPVFLGTELELSCGYDGASQGKMRRAASLLTSDPNVGQLVILKGDGSISGHGFEAVFHPMSYDWILENWPEDLLRRMRHAGAMPHSSCGMHVHVSRTGFSNPVHAYKWLKFMYRNAADLSRMARRNPSDWGSFGRPTERAAAKWHAKGGFGAENRYTAVNCMNEHTYEVRIFASTLNRTRFLGSLGLVDASIEYTRQLSTKDILQRDGWTFDPFRDYVTSFKKYAPVSKEMARLLNR